LGAGELCVLGHLIFECINGEKIPLRIQENNKKIDISPPPNFSHFGVTPAGENVKNGRRYIKIRLKIQISSPIFNILPHYEGRSD
jgi:hypothetical protein